MMKTIPLARSIVLGCAALAVAAGMAALSLPTRAAGPAARDARPAGSTATSAVPVVIQGRITAVQGATLTLRTPDQRPSCGGGQVCPMYVLAGVTFKVDIGKAVYQTFDGRTVKDKPVVGTSVIVVGTGAKTRASGIHTLHALVVERIALPRQGPPAG